MVLDLYVEYFVTPYFIFARDTLSYFFLLGLHATICLSPSAITFTMVEWTILVFFAGRFALELDQCYKSAPKGLSAATHHRGTKPAHRNVKSIASHMLYSYLRCVQQIQNITALFAEYIVGFKVPLTPKVFFSLI